jgi:hypothetical protein
MLNIVWVSIPSILERTGQKPLANFSLSLWGPIIFLEILKSHVLGLCTIEHDEHRVVQHIN